MPLNLSERELFDQFEVNVKSTFFIKKAIIKQMIDLRIRGKIINIASIMAKIGEASFTAYSATKHAVLGFSRCLAFEAAPYNICINAICPGIVDTDLERGIDI
jgi:NAD(P)-dependent dehydrogenase (short-subunit alcohol dehydrogenase family)